MKKKVLLLSIGVIISLTILIGITNEKENSIFVMEKKIAIKVKSFRTPKIYCEIMTDEHKLVAYVIGKNEYEKVGYAHFKLNQNGKYKLLNVIDASKIVKISDDIQLYEFVDITAGDFTTTYDIILSNNPSLSTIECIKQDGKEGIKEIKRNPSLTLFEELDSNINIGYRFYDKRGEIIHKLVSEEQAIILK